MSFSVLVLVGFGVLHIGLPEGLSFIGLLILSATFSTEFGDRLNTAEWRVEREAKLRAYDERAVAAKPGAELFLG